MASFGVFGSYLIIETSQEWGRILWNPWQCKLKLKYMKNPRFGALHSHLPSQSEIQGRKSEEKIQQPAVSHGCEKFLTPCETTWGSQGFHTPCQISHEMLCNDSVRFLSSDILCNFLVSPCNQPIYFPLYLLGSIYIRREKGDDDVCFS